MCLVATKKIYFLQEFQKKSSEELVIDLLLFYNSDKHHYVPIKDMCKFYCFLRCGIVVTCFYAEAVSGYVMTVSQLSMNTLKGAKIFHQRLFECPAETAISTNSTTGLTSGLPHW